MNNYLKILGLPEEDCINLSVAYSGYAVALEEQYKGNKRVLPIVASSWLLAATYKVILDPSASSYLFYRAASAYKKIDMGIWKVCGICSNNYESILKYDKQGFQRDKGMVYRDALYDFLLDYVSQKDYNYEDIIVFEKRNPDLLFQKIGNSDISVRLIIAVVRDSLQWGKDPFNNLSSLTELCRRSYELIEMYKSDTYHWKNLKGTVLPIDPVILSLSKVFVEKWKESGQSFQGLIKSISANESQKIFLEIANEIDNPRISYA